MKGKSQTFPLKASLFNDILNACDEFQKGFFIIAIPITCLKLGLNTPDLNSPMILFLSSCKFIDILFANF